MPFNGSLPDEIAPGEVTALRCKFVSPFTARRCNLVYDHGGVHEFGSTVEPTGSASSSPDECASPSGQHCWHYRSEIPGDECCVCEKRQLDDPPADAETAGEPEAPDCWACKHAEHRAFNCLEQLDGDDCGCGANAPTAAQEAAMQELTDLRQEMEAEPEAPECESPQGCDKVVPCIPGCAVSARALQAAMATPPRRPPYAVAYATEGGAQYEIALPGDATIRFADGALIITHASAVLALTQARPMEGA